MSSTPPRLLRRAVLCALTAGLLLAGASSAQPSRDGSDLLDQARRLREVAAQKLEGEVRDALRQAQGPDAAKAVPALRQSLALLEQDTALSPDKRESLKQMVRTHLRALGGDERLPETSARPVAGANRRADEQARAQEQEAVERGLASIRRLQVQGRYDEAQRLGRDLARQYPNNPAATAVGRISPAIDRAIDLNQLRMERERRFAGAAADVERSATPPAGDMEFPPGWEKKIRERQKLLVKISDREKAILDALNSPVSVDFPNAGFQQVISELEKATGQTILLDKPSLDEANVTYETPVKLQLRKVTFRTALRKVLSDLGLTYVIKDETIQVMTPAKARDTMTAKAYYIGDLLFVAGYPLPPVLNELQMAQTVTQLIDLIQRTVDPFSWQAGGGQGSITFNPATMSLVIKQSAEMHFILGSGIGGYAR
jgi:hypothetical protein